MSITICFAALSTTHLSSRWRTPTRWSRHRLRCSNAFGGLTSYPKSLFS